jgi:hypothetical protein
MHRLLIIKTFEKVISEEKKSTGIEPSVTSASKILSDYILETQRIPFGEKSLYNYYKASKKSENEDILIKQPKVVQAMSSYLGYDDYEDFKKANGFVSTKEKTSKDFYTIKKKNVFLLVIGLLLLVIIVLFSIYSLTKERWMVWDNNKYVEVEFNPKKYKLGQLKIYNENRIENFRKITVDCNTKFFDNSGKVKVWYGKNDNKQLEFFSTLGLHPETGKTLKPITGYMIDKYVCPKDIEY